MKKSPRSFRWILPAVLALASLGTAGCVVVAAGAAGAAGVAYLKGELEANVDAGFDATVTASEAAIANLELASIQSRRDRLVAVLVARTADDKRVEITVNAVSPDYTKVRIRVAVFGDEDMSLRILDEIRRQL